MTVTATFPPDLGVREREPMRQHTTLGVGGPADYWAEVRTLEELRRALKAAEELNIPRTIMGHGTNVLVADAGIEGLVIHNRASGLDVRADRRQIRVESGHTMAQLARRVVGEGLAGLTWAIGVPGTLGGAVHGNAGAFGSDMAAVLTNARVWYPDGEVTVSSDRLEFGYRTSALQDDAAGPVVMYADLSVRPGDLSALEQELRALAARRLESQPRGQNAGSFFKNPPGDFAGRLIEAAGLKNASHGGATVSEVHANFISNAGAATAADVVALAIDVRTRVEAAHGVRLEPEVRAIGRWGPEIGELFE